MLRLRQTHSIFATEVDIYIYMYLKGLFHIIDASSDVKYRLIYDKIKVHDGKSKKVLIRENKQLTKLDIF